MSEGLLGKGAVCGVRTLGLGRAPLVRRGGRLGQRWFKRCRYAMCVHCAVSDSPTSNSSASPEHRNQHWMEHLNVVHYGEKKSIEQYMGVLERVNDLEPKMQAMLDEELQGTTARLKAKVKSSGGKDALLQTDILAEAFAVVREASWRVLGMKHYDVQILGGIALSRGTVAEMRTGEGKTLVAILPAYLYSLEGKGAHIVTVNDYLAQRDAEWVGKVLEFLGCRVGVVTSKTPQNARAEELAADVTYLTAYELAFMYLQDNSAPPSFPVALNRPLHFAVVDEVDSILIDEARNPFIVNMPGADVGSETYWMISVQIAMQLRGPPVPENMNPEDLMNYFEGIPIEDFMSVDFIPDLRIKGTTITQRGMARAVRMLAHPKIGRVFIACEQNNPGKLYSIVVDVDIERAENTEGPDHFSCRLVISGIDWTQKDDDWLQEGYKTVLEIENFDEEGVTRAIGQSGLSLIPYEAVPDNVWTMAIPSVLWSGGSKAWGRYLNQATRAVHAFHKDIDYIVRGGEIVVIDSATGRERDRSRWQAGLHQALEAKEMLLENDDELKIRPEDFDQGKITYQVLFSEYNTLSGMTGTAVTEAEEFEEAYGLSVVRIPPHKPSVRVDYPLEVYGGKSAWSQHLLDLTKEAVTIGRPVLIGTMSVETSEEVHQILSKAPFNPHLTEIDCLAMISALSRLPKSLPAPPVLDDKNVENNQELESTINFYERLMIQYDNILKLLKEQAQSRGSKMLPVEDIKYSMAILRGVMSARLWSLKSQTEFDAIEECYDILQETMQKSRLSEQNVINLLNARPERSRKEAEIVAQAGVPGTITVATSMAGRGTDILLGGNPKGLVLTALKFLFSGYIIDQNQIPELEIPLAKVNPAFVQGEDSMARHLPDLLYQSFYNSAKEIKQDKTLLNSMTEIDAFLFLEKVVEKTELIRSHLKLSLLASRDKKGDQTTLELFSNEFDRENWSSENVINSGTLSQLESEVPHSRFKCLLKYALLQWLWFDEECAKMAEQVRSSGGLCVIIASVPESRRAELQLRGRAGRQGDPGTTSIIASLEDPIITAALLPNQQKDIWAYIEDSGSSNEPLPSLVIDPIIKSVVRNQEQLQQGGRDVSRKYDAVIDSYRRHIYRLRRILTHSGEISRASLFHSNLRDMAEDLVEVHCPGNEPFDAWNLGSLLEDIMSLLYQPRLSLAFAHDSEMISVSQAFQPESIALSMHLIEDNIMAVAEDVTDATKEQPGIPLCKQLEESLRKRQWDSMPALDFRKSSTSIASIRRKCMLGARKTENAVNRKQALVSWVGDVLSIMYETKRSLSHEALTCSKLTNEPLNPFQSSAILRLWERDIALESIDSLWSDFLQDATILQAASQSRAFSMFDPVDEFRLEAAAAFTNLLRQYSQIISTKILGPVDLNHLRYLESSGSPRGLVAKKQEQRNIEFVLQKIVKTQNT